jgi:hypothetical protein
MFHTKESDRRPTLIWLALSVSIALHLVLGAGIAALDVTVPGSHVAEDRALTPSVAVHVESVVGLDS